MWKMKDQDLHLLLTIAHQQACQPPTLVRYLCQRDVVLVTQPRDLSFYSVLAHWFPLDTQFLHVSSARVQPEVVVLPEV